MNKVRWGILGAARVNEKLLPAIVNSGNSQLVAVGSRRPEAAKECLIKNAPELEDQVQCFDGLDSVINHDRIDAIYIPMANEEHVQPALKSIRAKKHVLIEKPMALKSSEVQILIDEAKNNNVKIMEGFMYAFHPQFDRIKNVIQSNILGEVNYAHSMFSFPIKSERFYRINRSLEKGGGALWDVGPYAVHTIRSCFKENPLSVYGQSRINEHGADMSTTGIIDFGNNKRATFDISFECLRRCEFEAFGPLGRVKCPVVWQADDVPAKIIYTTEKSGTKEETVPTANHFELEINHFNDVIQKNIPLKLSNEDALWNAKTLEAIQKSIKTKMWVDL